MCKLIAHNGTCVDVYFEQSHYSRDINDACRSATCRLLKSAVQTNRLQFGFKCTLKRVCSGGSVIILIVIVLQDYSKNRLLSLSAIATKTINAQLPDGEMMMLYRQIAIAPQPNYLRHANKMQP